MPLSPKTEPVILAAAIPALLSATVALIAVFTDWELTKEQETAFKVFLAAFLPVGAWLLRKTVTSPKTAELNEALHVTQEAVLVDERNQAMATATEAVRAAETVTATQDAMAKLVAGEVVAKLDEQVGAAPRRARPAEPSDLEHGVYWAPPPPPPANRQPIRVGSRVKVLSGKLEGRWGSVIETVAGRSLVFEDGPDDTDDWVPNDQLEPLGEWVQP